MVAIVNVLLFILVVIIAVVLGISMFVIIIALRGRGTVPFQCRGKSADKSTATDKTPQE